MAQILDRGKVIGSPDTIYNWLKSVINEVDCVQGARLNFGKINFNITLNNRLDLVSELILYSKDTSKWQRFSEHLILLNHIVACLNSQLDSRLLLINIFYQAKEAQNVQNSNPNTNKEVTASLGKYMADAGQSLSVLAGGTPLNVLKSIHAIACLKHVVLT